MINQYWNTVEQEMVSAWKDGGEVDGKPVTDERLLQFWTERRDAMSRDDPMWDYYNNLHDQYKFNIAESKVGLAYAQKKMSAREVATWYKGQADNYPEHSEIWRTIMGQAAKFLDAARAQSSASATERRTKAYVQQRDDHYRTEIYPGLVVMQALVAVGRGLNTAGMNGSLTWQGAFDQGAKVRPEEGLDDLGNGSSLLNLAGTQLNQSSGWEEILYAINNNVPMPGTGIGAGDYFRSIAFGRKTTTGKEIPVDEAALGTLDRGDLEAIRQQVNKGYDDAIHDALKFDDIVPVGTVEDLRQKKTQRNDELTFALSLDDQQDYAARNQALESVLNNPQADPFQQMNAFSSYLDYLGGKQAQVGQYNPAFSALLMGEMRDILGNNAGLGATVAEGALAAPLVSGGVGPTAEYNPQTGSGGNASRYAYLFAAASDTIKQLGDGQSVLWQDPASGLWSAKPIAQLSAETGDTYVLIPQQANATLVTPDNSSQATVLQAKYATVAQPIYYSKGYQTVDLIVQAPAFPVNPVTGAYSNEQLGLAAGNSDQNIGKVLQIPTADGQGVRTVFGIYVDGKLRWTTTSPFKQGAAVSQGVRQVAGGDAYVVTINADPKNSPPPDQGGWVVPVYDTTPGGGTSDQIKTYTFDPQAVTDMTIFAPRSTQSFIDPGFAYQVSIESERQKIGTADIGVLYEQYRHSQWVDWNNSAEVSQFVGDVAAVKSSETSSKDPNNPLHGLGGDLALWSQLSTLRSGGEPNPWWTTITQGTGVRANALPQMLKNVAAESGNVWNRYNGEPIKSFAAQMAAGNFGEITTGHPPTLVEQLGAAATAWAQQQVPSTAPPGYPPNYQNGPYAAQVPYAGMPGQAPAYAQAPMPGGTQIKTGTQITVPTAPQTNNVAPRGSTPSPSGPAFNPIISPTSPQIAPEPIAPPPPPPPPPVVLPGAGGNLHLPGPGDLGY